ncbi:MAG TPA: metal ABC transporter permease [Longimicrobium sp.]|nr:metal ABC transporter permease [Longimicrobium sp.]
MQLPDLFGDYTLRTVALGAAALGATSGALGSYAVLRKQSLLGDAISHAALPGIALAFLLTGSKAPLVLVLGALAAGWIGTLLVMRIVGSTRVKEDSALGIVLSVFFGFGLVLLTFIQKRPDASQAGLDRFLFGQAATLLHRDVVMIAALGGIALGVAALFWKEFKLLTFDPDFGASLGFPIRALDVLLTTVLVLSIVIGLQTVGVVLMSAMVVAPAAAARQWTDRMGGMVILAGGFGALAGVSGAVISSLAQHVPTGPTIVLCLTALVIVSLTLAPNRGLVWESVRQARNRRRLHMDAVLRDLNALAVQHGGQEHVHATAVLETMHPGARHELHELEDRGWARRTGADGWSITTEGKREMERRGGGGGDEEGS